MTTEPLSTTPAGAPRRRSLPRRLINWLLVGLIVVAVVVMLLWGALALHFSTLPGIALRNGLAGVFVMGSLAAFALLHNRLRTLKCFAVLSALMIAGWVSIKPATGLTWAPEYAKLPYADIDDDRITVHNIRNFDYRTETDFDARYDTRTYDLTTLISLDLIAVDWGVTNVVHTMLSFGFADGRHLALSVEPRRQADQPHTDALGSLFKQYQVVCVIGDECDLLRLRTNFRERENMYVLPTASTRQNIREVFMMVIRHINDLRDDPKFYNLLTHNCTTSLLPIINRAMPEARWWDLRILLNASIGRLAYDRGWIRTNLSYADMIQRSQANPYVADHPECAGYSERIRPGLMTE